VRKLISVIATKATARAASMLAGVMVGLCASVVVIGSPRQAAGDVLMPFTQGNSWTYELSSQSGKHYKMGVLELIAHGGKMWAKMSSPCLPQDYPDTNNYTLWRNEPDGLFDNKGACQDIRMFCDDIRFAYPVIDSSYLFVTDCICYDGHADTAHMTVHPDTLTVPAGTFSGFMYHGTGFRYDTWVSDWTFFALEVGLVAEWWNAGGDVDTLRLASFHLEIPDDVRDTPNGEATNQPNLSQSYPNPFNSGTNICFTLDRDGRVSLGVFDILGRHVKTLVDQVQPAGRHEITWDGTDSHGQAVASGMYFYRLTNGGRTESKKMVLLK